MWWFFILEIKPDNAHDFRLHLDQIYEFIQYCSKLICLHNTNLNLVSEKEKKHKNSCIILRFDIFLQQFKKSMMLEKDPIVVFNNVTVGWSIFPTRGFYQRKLRSMHTDKHWNIYWLLFFLRKNSFHTNEHVLNMTDQYFYCSLIASTAPHSQESVF